MKTINQFLHVSFVLAGLLDATAAGEKPWYYHVRTGGTGGQPVQSEADPGLSSCWNSINAAFAAVKSRATPGPWVIQVDDEATYDEAVALSDLQTSSTETLTLTKAPWLVGRPTIYPSQPCQSALAIDGRWPGGDPLPGQLGQPSLPGQPGRPFHRLTYFTVRGFILKNNAAGTGKNAELNVFWDNQSYLTEGLHIIEDCVFDGQNQVYDARIPILIHGTCINTVFRRNVVRDFTIDADSRRGQGLIFLTFKPVSTVAGQPRVTVADNTFCGNHEGGVFECFGDALNKRYYQLIFERNTVSGNYASTLVEIYDNPLSNTIRNNVFSQNKCQGVTLWMCANSSNTRVYHNTFFKNQTRWEVLVANGSTDGVEIKNNIFWPTPGSYCIEVAPGCTRNLISTNNAFFTDFRNDGYPPGFGFSTTENTETVGLWNGKPLTTDAWNKASKNNVGNGYVFEGPGLNKDMHLVAGSLCIDRGVSGLVSDDIDGKERPAGSGFDIGADEYGTTGTARPLGGEQEPQLEGQQTAVGATLQLAAYLGDLAKMEASIQEGVDIDKLDGRGYTPLHYAAQNSQKQAIELLIAKGGDINVRDSRGQTPLDRAGVAGNREMAELLIAKGAEVSLYTAINLGDVDRARGCLEKGVDVNTRDKDGHTALHLAVENKLKDVAELLIAKGADLNAKDARGYTPLYVAIRANDANMVRVLVSKGADVNLTPEKDYPPLHYAVWEKAFDTVRLLVDHGARFDVKNQDGWSAFRCAASAGRRDMIDLFVAKGADVSSLPLAAGVGNLARVRSLVEQGADVDAKDELGWTPLHWAASLGRTETVEFLAAKGANVNARDNRGNTPLHDAAAAGHRDMTELLIGKGADTAPRDKQGWTPLMYAEQRRHSEVAELLRKHGAKE